MSTLIKAVLVVAILSIQSVFGQENQIKTGAVLEIIKPEGPFRHVILPRQNAIIKRGGIPNLNALSGQLVVVTSSTEVGGGQQLVLRRKDGRKFFRNYRTIKANWPEAFEAGELRPKE